MCAVETVCLCVSVPRLISGRFAGERFSSLSQYIHEEVYTGRQTDRQRERERERGRAYSLREPGEQRENISGFRW